MELLLDLALEVWINSTMAQVFLIPTNSSLGFDPAQIRLVFHPAWGVNVFLTYAKHFDLVPQPTHHRGTTHGYCPDPVTRMYVVKRSLRSNGS